MREEVRDEPEITSLKEAKNNLEAVSSFLEAHAQANRHPRTLRVQHELDLQAERLEEIIKNGDTE